MFLTFKIKRLLKKYFNASDNEITNKCFWEIMLIINDRKLFKKYKNFIYMVCDYKKRKGNCTQVQLDALVRVLNG